MIYIFYYQRHIAILISSPYHRLRLKKEISARLIDSPYTATTFWPHNIKHIDTDLIYPPKGQKLLFFGCGHFLSFCDLGAFFEFPYMVSGHTPPPATLFPDQTEHSEHIICQIENKRPFPIVKKFAIGSSHLAQMPSLSQLPIVKNFPIGSHWQCFESDDSVR